MHMDHFISLANRCERPQREIFADLQLSTVMQKVGKVWIGRFFA